MLHELVSLDVWHQPLLNPGDTSPLHVDVVFTDARMGGDADSNVRFKLEIERASLVLRLPEDGTIGVLRDTVERGEKPVFLKVQSSVIREGQKQAALSSAANWANAVFGFSASASASINNSSTSKQQADLECTVPKINAICRVVKGNYQWDLFPALAGPLKGRPWVASAEPRMTILDKRSNKRHIHDAVCLEIHCLREDLKISDIHMKADGQWRLLSSFKSGVKVAAAEALIMNRLSDEMLHVESLKDGYTPVILASVLAES